MTEATEVPASARAASIWEDLVDIFFSPREVFERRRFDGFGPALLLLTVLLVILTIPTQLSLAGMMTDVLREGLATAGGAEPTTAQIDQMRRISMIAGVAGTAVTVPVAAIVSGLVLSGLGGLAGVRLPVRAAILVAVWSGFPRVWAMVVTMLQGSLLEPVRMTDLSLGPARFLDADASPVLVGLLSRLDIFTVWAVVLAAIGVMVIGGASRGKAVALAVAVWLVGSIPVVLGAFFAGTAG